MVGLIKRARTAESSKEFAENLGEHISLQKCFQKKLTADDVFDLLKLKEMGYHIFGSHQLRMWSSYVMKVSQHMRYQVSSSLSLDWRRTLVKMS
ncbi:hypothetical protein PsorP6_016135 [Peronosclerospora sorghi]|uniref:Uncharacterized protein n=1 Tax=Peronosclerospora sorghi TaxID=230839 RepID=A0ACC0VNJ9_9STRA|nr:hypothetical protein PsorP6_016135 [Peronosclerospora sorghi]